MRLFPKPSSLAQRTQWGLVACAIVLSVAFRLLGPDMSSWRSVINDDGVCYYEYLRSAFITGDHVHDGTPAWFLSSTDGAPAIKCFCGTALLQLPFFLLAHVRSLFPHGPEDGYSLHYQLAIAMAGLFYFALGLRTTRKLLEHLGIAGHAVAITLSIITLGTGLLYYAVWSPGMSHVYGFAIGALVLRRAQRMEKITPPGLLQLAWVLGLLVLVRPTDVIILLAVPLFRPATDLKGLRVALRLALWPVVAFLLIVCIQPAWWYLRSGQALIAPYSGEGFLWGRPRLWSVLLGAKRGLFFYWPLLLLVLPGLVLLRRRALPAVLHFVVLTYLTCTWWAWYYGSYGMRPFVDHLAVLALPIAMCFVPLGITARRWIMVPVIALLALQIFQSWQYTVGLLNSGDMDLEKYKRAFLRTDPALRFAFGGAYYEPPYAPHGLRVLREEPPKGTRASPLVLGSDQHADLSIMPDTSVTADLRLFIELSLDRRESTPRSSRAAIIHTQLGEEGPFLVHERFLLNGSPDATPGWRHWRYAYSMPPFHGRPLIISIENTGEAPLVLSGLRLRVSTPAPAR